MPASFAPSSTTSEPMSCFTIMLTASDTVPCGAMLKTVPPFIFTMSRTIMCRYSAPASHHRASHEPRMPLSNGLQPPERARVPAK